MLGLLYCSSVVLTSTASSWLLLCCSLPRSCSSPCASETHPDGAQLTSSSLQTRLIKIVKPTKMPSTWKFSCSNECSRSQTSNLIDFQVGFPQILGSPCTDWSHCKVMSIAICTLLPPPPLFCNAPGALCCSWCMPFCPALLNVRGPS